MCPVQPQGSKWPPISVLKSASQRSTLTVITNVRNARFTALSARILPESARPAKLGSRLKMTPRSAAKCAPRKSIEKTSRHAPSALPTAQNAVMSLESVSSATQDSGLARTKPAGRSASLDGTISISRSVEGAQLSACSARDSPENA